MQFAKLPTTRYSDALARVIRAAGIQGPQAYDYMFSSGQANFIGLYYINTALAAIETCMSEAEFIGYIEKFETAGILKFDRENYLVWVIEGAARNIGELKQAEGKKPDNKVVMVNKAFKLVPAASPLKAAFYERYAEMLKLEGVPAVAPAKAATQAPAPAPAPAPAAEVEVRADELDPGLVSKWGYRDLLKMLTGLRELERDDYPVASDVRFKARAERLLEDLGAASATECLDWSMRNRDLALDATMQRVYPEEFVPEAVDI